MRQGGGGGRVVSERSRLPIPRLGFGAEGKATRIDQMLGPELARLRENGPHVIAPWSIRISLPKVAACAAKRAWYTQENIASVMPCSSPRSICIALLSTQPPAVTTQFERRASDHRRQGISDDNKDGLIPDLWSSLFLVVPPCRPPLPRLAPCLAVCRSNRSAGCWSTSGPGPAPAGIGALMRVKRSIVVGDPVQVEPVVLRAEDLTSAICKTFGVDAQRFGAPAARCRRSQMKRPLGLRNFRRRVGSRTVGVPLLVHRRCANPMFGIANRVAYEGLTLRQSHVRHRQPRRL
jgi:hypothetical protein